MSYWKIYAFILNDEIKNICVYAPDGSAILADVQARQAFGDSAIAVDVTQYPVAIGDKYSDHKFYRNGTEIEALPTEEESIARHTEQIDSANSEIDDIWVTILEE